MGGAATRPRRDASRLHLLRRNVGTAGGGRAFGPEALAPAVTSELVVVADTARAAVERFLPLQPRTIALAGGSTPLTLYRCLAALDYPWGEVDVFFGGERCVPPEHVDSNYRLAYDAFLCRVAARVHRMPGESCDPISTSWS